MQKSRAVLSFIVLSMGAYSFTSAAERVKITYRFETILSPDWHMPSPKIVKASENIARGSFVPHHGARLDQGVFIDNGITIPRDTPIALATSTYKIGCTVERIMKFRLGISHICLIDTDQDGKFDKWFRRGNGVVFDHSSSRIFLDDLKHITPTPFREVTPSDLSTFRSDVGFEIFWTGKSITSCRTYRGKRESFCSTSPLPLSPGINWHNFSYLGGVFKYRSAQDDDIEIEILRPVPMQRQDGNPG